MSSQLPVARARYTPLAQALHWLTALLVLLTVPIAWVMVNLPADAHIVGRLFTLHESIGLTILIIVAVRLIWRARGILPHHCLETLDAGIGLRPARPTGFSTSFLSGCP